MCDDCFKTETKNFQDKQTWESFDLELMRKVGQGKAKHLKFIPDRFRGTDDGQDIYKCLSCGQTWTLRDLWDFEDGYFLKLTLFEKLAIRLTERQKLILGLLVVPLLIIAIVLYWLWTN